MENRKIRIKKIRIIMFVLVGLAVVMNVLLQISWSKQLPYSNALAVILLAYILLVNVVFACLLFNFKIKTNYEKES